MITEKVVMKTEVRYSEDREYKYLTSKEWNNKKPRAMVIMTNAGIAGEVVLDLTTRVKAGATGFIIIFVLKKRYIYKDYMQKATLKS